MSDYSQITFFTPKDGLATGNPNKIIYGSDVDAELSAISTAIATKADVDGDAIGAGTPATELSVDNLKLDANKIISTNTDGDIELEPNGAGYVVITNVDVAAGEIDGTTIGANSAAAGTFTTANATTVDTTNLEVTNLKAKDGTAAGSIADVTGVVTLASSVLTTTDINGGTIDGAIIGGATPAAITGTTLTANTSLALATGATVTAILDEDAMTSNSATALATQQSIKAYVDSQVTAQDLDVTTDSGTIAIDLDSETLTVAGGTGLDTSATGNTVTVAIDSTVATLTGAQTLTNKVLTSPDINTPDIDGGTIDGATIATSDITVGAGKTLDVSAGTLTLANDQISGDKIEGGTIGSVTITTADINGGSLDGTVIGAATPAAGSFTTGQFGTSLNVDGTVTADGLTVDANSTTGAVKIQSGDNNTFGAGRAQLALSYNATDDYQHFVRTSHDVVSSGNKVELLICDGTQNNTITSGSNRVISLAGNGDISFYEDTGTTPKFFWDASAESLGIGTSSPSALIHVEAADGAAGGAIKYTASGVASGYMSADAAGLCLATDTAGITFRTGITGNDPTDTGSERMRINSSGRVGIGTSSLSAVFTVSEKAATTLATFDSTAARMYFGINNTATSYFDCDTFIFRNSPSSGATERMRIDSSGNVLVGKTTSDLGATAGIELNGQYDVGYFTRSGDKPLVANRLSSDGTIVDFRKDGSVVGSINAHVGDLSIGTGDVRLKFSDSGSKVSPRGNTDLARDGAIDLGGSSDRFRNLYLSGGVYLGGTGAANLLDDYETGTFVPTVIGTSVAGTASYAAQGGRYVKIGNLVHFQLNVNYSSFTGTGSLRVAGLPFTQTFNASTAPTTIYTLAAADLTWGGSVVYAYAISGSTQVGIAYMDTGASTSNVSVDSAARLEITGAYYTTA